MSWAIFDYKKHIDAVNEIVNGSDRVVAIVGGTFLDETLRHTLEARLRDHEKKRGKLFEVGRPLGNLEPKIDLLFLLYAFEKPVRDALYGICNIRNLFAHNLNIKFDSDSPKMKAALELLKLHEGRTHYPHHLMDKNDQVAIEDIKDNRTLFMVNLKCCLAYLMRDRISHEPCTNRLLTPAEFQARLEKDFPEGVPQ